MTQMNIWINSYAFFLKRMNIQFWTRHFPFIFQALQVHYLFFSRFYAESSTSFERCYFLTMMLLFIHNFSRSSTFNIFLQYWFAIFYHCCSHKWDKTAPRISPFPSDHFSSLPSFSSSSSSPSSSSRCSSTQRWARQGRPQCWGTPIVISSCFSGSAPAYGDIYIGQSLPVETNLSYEDISPHDILSSDEISPDVGLSCGEILHMTDSNVEQFLHMRNVNKSVIWRNYSTWQHIIHITKCQILQNLFLKRFMLFCRKIIFVASYALLHEEKLSQKLRKIKTNVR